MQATLLIAVALTTVACCSAVDAECKYRNIRQLPTHWANPIDCTRYFRCTSKNIMREVKCAEGKVYNPEKGRCSPNKPGLCKLTLMAPLAETLNPCDDQISGAYLPETGYCRNFYICNNNKAYPQVCDAGSAFNVTSGNCIPDPDSECWQNKCMNQTDGSYLPNALSCSSFYVCANGEAKLQSCNNGSYFNSSDSVCVPDPTGSYCWENLCYEKKNGDFVKDMADCYSYYVCAGAKPIKQYCPEGSYFDSLENSCLPGICPTETTTCQIETTTACSEETTTCRAETTTACPQETTTCRAETTTACPPETTTCRAETTTACPQETTTCRAETTTACAELTTTTECVEISTTTQCAGIATTVAETDCSCPGGYREGQLIPFPNYRENCNKYYVCTDGKLKERDCGKGNRFDGNLGVCVPDTNNACSTTQCPEKITATPEPCITCPDGYKQGELVPLPNYPGNCDKYYICIDGRFEERECGKGNRFDVKLEICVPDTHNICKPTVSTECPEDTPPTVETNCTCPGGYTEGEFVPLPNYYENCDKYYICIDGRLEERECGKGNRFDVKLGICVPDTQNICKPTGTTECPEVTTSSVEPNCTCPGGYKEGELLPFPNYLENCAKYYICTNGRLEERECCMGSRFDSKLGMCVTDTDNVCWPNICHGQPDGTIKTDPKNCTTFYLCEGGKGEVYECPAEKWFDPLHQICMPDVNANCINPCKDTTGIIFLPNPDCSKYFLCNNGKPFVETCPSGGFDVKLGKCSANAVCEATLCLGREDGTTFPVAGNDTMFYLCLGGVPQIDQCTAGKVYSAAVGVCLEEPSSKCDQSKCNTTTPEDGAFAPLVNRDDTAFCLCHGGAAFLHHCTDDYTFRPDLGICYSNAPCDPEICEVYPENTRSQNRNDTQSFCLCVSKEQVIVNCPNNQTYNPVSQLCQTQDDKCSSTFCLSAPEYTIFPALNNDIDGYCVCLASGPVYRSCENGGKFDVNKKICLSNTEKACSSLLCSGNNGLIFGANGDPHSFCYCNSDGIAIERSCPNSGIFNDTLMICQAVGCDGQVCLTNPSVPFPAENEPYSFCVCTSTDPSSVTKHGCPNGSRFDPYYLICKEDACNENICSGGASDGVTSPANNYPQGYCLCSNGIPVLNTCPSGTFYNSTSGVCSSATNAECDLSACANTTAENTYPVVAKNDLHGFCYCLSSTVVEFHSCPGDSLFDPARGICNITTPADDCTCPGGYHEGQILPNPTNCRLYYVCSHGRLEEFDCGAGKFFDKASLICQPLGRSSDLTSNQFMHSEAIREDDDLLCVENARHSVLSNCTQYEICIDGFWIRLSCPNEWYYNSEQSKCMEPPDDTVCEYARIKNLPVCDASMEQRIAPSNVSDCAQYYRCTHGKWRSKPCPQQHYYSKRFHTCLLSRRVDVCAERHRAEFVVDAFPPKCQHMSVRHYEHNCAMYLICLEGKWWHHYCALGMYFNRTYNYCMPNAERQCNIAFETSIEVIPQQPCNSEGLRRPSNFSCNRYQECRDGFWVIRYCNPQQYFDATERVCLSDVDGVCEEAHSFNCTENERREFPFNCTAYEICIRGEWQRKNCNASWAFDSNLLTCVPNDGSCADNGLRAVCNTGDTHAYPLPGNCTQFFYCLDDTWIAGTCLEGYTYAKASGECVPHAEHDECQPMLIVEDLAPNRNIPMESEGNQSALCLGHADGSLVPHPGNCLFFFVCSSGEATNGQKCIKGSYFDAKHGYCRPNNGECLVPLAGMCANATDEERIVNPDDCRSYYHCSILNGAELLYCASGEYFQNSTKQCRLNKGECIFEAKQSLICGDTLDHGKRLPHERYCNIYYACVRGLAILVTCPAEHQFVPAIGDCVYHALLDCETGTLLQALSNNTVIESCAKLTDGAHLPVVTDCTKYVICLEGSGLMKTCPLGTFFDAEQRLCLPDDGSCPYVESNNTANKQPLGPDPLTCEGKHGSMMPSPFNCNEFYCCINGKLHKEQCYTNYYFDSLKNQCRPYERTYYNENGDVNGNSTEVKIVKKNLEEKPIPNVQQCNDKPSSYSELCSRIPKSSLIAEQGDCRRYIRCNENAEPVYQRCRNGESFDSLLGFCRQNDGTCLLENGQRVGECNGRHGQLVRDDENCRGYFVCINGQKIGGSCEEHEFFNKSLAACQEDANNVCGGQVKQTNKMQELSCIGLSDTTLYPYVLDNCRSYFQCIKGSPIVQECADGLYFNATLTRCVKEVVECVMPGTVALEHEPELRHPWICDGTTSGQRYANKRDNCRSFYICEENGSITSINCPVGELYDSKSGVCVISENVFC